ncbi:MAG: STAS domain-containing protein [Candidatus Poribacteria bacterium]|nr:STAS domain-containing protein [Candidatus Poribacteria bacterium]
MRVNLRKRGDVTILEIKGRIAGADSLALQGTLAGRIAATLGQAVKLLVKLEKIRMMDSTALSVLVAASRAIQQNGGQMALLNVGGIRNFIAQAKLMLVCALYESEDEAIASLQ